MKTLLVLSLLFTASCGAQVATAPMRDEKAMARLDLLLGGKVAGQTRSCISRRDAERQEIIDDRTIIYRANSQRIIRGDISPSCTGLSHHSTLIRRSISSEICAGEIFEVRDAGSGFNHGSCTYGEFTEYNTPIR